MFSRASFASVGLELVIGNRVNYWTYPLFFLFSSPHEIECPRTQALTDRLALTLESLLVSPQR